MLDIRQTFGVPIFLGESGENSNVWFRDAIRLLEDHGIGWAWWPMKNRIHCRPAIGRQNAGVSSIAGLLEGNRPCAFCRIREKCADGNNRGLKLENCVFQKDVIDAMFRQVYSDETAPFKTRTFRGGIFHRL